MLRWPAQPYERVTTPKYTSQTWPNARLAGLLTEDGQEDNRRLVPLLFAQVRLTPPMPGRVPRLRSCLRERSWAFLWDARLQTGYLLIVPPSRERREVRFDVRWDG